MIRLLWVFLVIDVAVSALLMGAEWLLDAPKMDRGDINMRVLIELAALAIIEAVRERKV